MSHLLHYVKTITINLRWYSYINIKNDFLYEYEFYVTLTHREAHVCQLFDETIHDPGIFLLPWDLSLSKMKTENDYV